jgi:hypothetical protein
MPPMFCYGKRPMQTFRDAKYIPLEKILHEYGVSDERYSHPVEQPFGCMILTVCQIKCCLLQNQTI